MSGRELEVAILELGSAGDGVAQVPDDGRIFVPSALPGERWRVRLERKDLRNLDAAEWEFTYTKGNVPLHNIDLGVVTGSKSFALNFETRTTNWDAVHPLFQRFESSFRPPTS